MGSKPATSAFGAGGGGGGSFGGFKMGTPAGQPPNPPPMIPMHLQPQVEEPLALFKTCFDNVINKRVPNINPSIFRTVGSEKMGGGNLQMPPNFV